jgi:L-ascorbate metabolism protein UlaG (beta-lactamase superfamily)
VDALLSPTTESSVRWIGHATVLITLDGTRLLTDPLLRRRTAHLRRRAPLVPVTAEGLGAVLLSHAHYDHLDMPSLRLLGRSVPIVAPSGLGSLLRRRGFDSVHEVEPGEVHEVGTLRIEATFAAHDGARPPLPARAPALGFAVHGSRRLYFAGDTDLFPEMAGLVPDLDLALVPIWGWGPSLGRGEHLDPERAAEAVALLRPRIAVPIHWGTYAPAYIAGRRALGFLEEPPRAFTRAMAEKAPDVDVRILAPGEVLALDEGESG